MEATHTRRFALAAVLSAWFTSAAVAQHGYIETLEVTIHNADVVVTDGRGEPVAGLTAADFEVMDGGVPQTVRNFSVCGQAATSDASSTPEESRTFVFYVDEMALHPATRAQLFKGAERLLATAMHDGDRGMIVAPALAQPVRLAVTSDRKALIDGLRRAIDANGFRIRTDAQLEGRWLDRQAELGATGNATEWRQAMRVYAGRMRKRAEQRLGRLRSTVAALREVPGRKVVVLVTNSLPAVPGLLDPSESTGPPEAGSIAESDGMAIGLKNREQVFAHAYVPQKDLDWFDLRPMIREVARVAASSGATIYPLQPEQQLELAVGGVAADSRRRKNGSGRTVTGEMKNTDIALSLLASETGGVSTRGAIASAFDGVRRDLNQCYSIGFTPTSKRAEARRLEIRVRNHPEYRVRTRASVVEQSLEQQLTDRTVARLSFPLRENELPVRVELGPHVKELNKIGVLVTVRIPIRSLTLLREGEVHRGMFRVHYAAIGARFDFSSGAEREQIVEIPSAKLDAALQQDWIYETRFELAAGTEYQIAIGVMDAVSKLTGFETVTVDTR